MPTSGSKRELTARIDAFLRTGQRLGLAPKARRSAAAQQLDAATAEHLTLDTRVPAGARCTQQMREFFVRHLGPRFHFTITLQRFIRAPPNVSLGDIAAEWQLEQKRRHAGWRPEIGPQFEFNQFTRDFHADPANRSRSRQDCLAAWKAARARLGAHRYVPCEAPAGEAP